MTPLDRAHRVVLGTEVERLEHVPRRILATFTVRVLMTLQRNTGILGFLGTWFEVWKIS